jgi:transposase
MEKITTIGLDLAKSVFHVHAVAEDGRVVIRRALRRSQLLEFFCSVEPCLVGLEACASAHHWANVIGQFGHTVRMMPPAYVKAYVKRNKTDAADAEAICEAVTRSTMRFVPIKSPEEQAAGMVLKTRELFIRQRSQTANAMRAHLAELGIVAAAGMTSIAKLIAVLRNRDDARLPTAARIALLEMAEQVEMLTARIETLDKKIIAAVKADETARRLTTIPGIGPIIAATVRAVIQGADREDIETREQAVANTADRWRDVHPEAGAARRAATFVDHLTDETSALQSRRRRAGQQDCSNDLGASCQRRHLPSAGDHGEGIEHKEFRRLGAGMKWQGAKV